MAVGVRQDLLAAGLAVFDRDGFEGATVAAIRTRARASNGSFFHCFGSKKELAGTLFLEVLRIYHAAILATIDPSLGAQDGIDRLIRAHFDWVVNNRREARYLFEISRSEWTEEIRAAQRIQNSRLADGIESWRAPLIARGELLPMTAHAVLQPDHRTCADFLPRMVIGSWSPSTTAPGATSKSDGRSATAVARTPRRPRTPR